MLTGDVIRQQLVRSERCANIFTNATNIYCMSSLWPAVGQTLGTWRRTKLPLELGVIPLNTILVLLGAKGPESLGTEEGSGAGFLTWPV